MARCSRLEVREPRPLDFFIGGIPEISIEHSIDLVVIHPALQKRGFQVRFHCAVQGVLTSPDTDLISRTGLARVEPEAMAFRR